ncbi:hypothetical protein SAY87_023103 [Trapa incisa]|uniref:DUF4378 domain-containing protein n=1 Tax=Trapa incisa TaxID=236973 RepID=A0AAN7K5F2_9MYRT|nr:hypothetical protein SAY87_023103 [Trapa incisa]
MGSWDSSKSVIAKLMGLDDLPNQHPSQKRGRVLSEKYFQRVASIGVREKSPSLEEKNLHLSRNVKIRCPERALCVLGGLSENPCIPLEIALTRPRHGTEQDSSSVDFSWARSCKVSTAGYMKPKAFLGSSNELELPGQRRRVTSEEVEEICKQLKLVTTRHGFLSGKKSKSRNCQSSVSSSTSSFIAREAKKEIRERFMMMEPRERGSGSRGKTLGEMLSMQSHGMKPHILNYGSLGSRKGMKNGVHITTHSKRSELSGQPFVHNSREKSFTWMEGLIPGKASLFSISGADDRNLDTSLVKEPRNSHMKARVSSSANSSETLLEEEEELTEFVEECSGSSHSFKSFGEVYQYQQSPDSVLRPVEDETLSDLWNEISGLQVLPSCKLDSLEQSLEENGMALSGEEEDKDAGSFSFSNYEETEDSMRFLRGEDSRYFSYLVDVLSEAGLRGGTMIECPIDSEVFEALEKKYGEQKSWRRSERKLFFDRINLVLMTMMETHCQSIFMPSWAKSVASHMSFIWGGEITEEALWAVLDRQEKEAKKQSGNVLEDGPELLDFGECVDTVCREVEKVLVQELGEEFF